MNNASLAIENIKLLLNKKNDADAANVLSCSPASLSAIKIKNLLSALFDKILNLKDENRLSLDAIFFAQNSQQLVYFTISKDLFDIVKSQDEEIMKLNLELKAKLNYLLFVQIITSNVEMKDTRDFFLHIAAKIDTTNIDILTFFYIFCLHCSQIELTKDISLLKQKILTFYVFDNNDMPIVNNLSKTLEELLIPLSDFTLLEIINKSPLLVNQLSSQISNNIVSALTKFNKVSNGKNIFDKFFKIIFEFDALEENMIAAFLLMLYSVENLKSVKKPISYKKFLLEAIDQIKIDKKSELLRGPSKNDHFTLVIFEEHRNALKKFVLKDLTETEAIVVVENYPKIIDILDPKINIFRKKGIYKRLFQRIKDTIIAH